MRESFISKKFGIIFFLILLLTTSCSSTQQANNSVLVQNSLPAMPSDFFLSSDFQDSAVGQTIPSVSFINEKQQTAIEPFSGKPKMIFFLAPWCDHCDDELTSLKVVFDDLGENVDKVETHLVITDIRKNQANYPPDEWIASRNLPDFVNIHYDDDNNSAFGAYGGDIFFPYSMIVSPDGKVAFRAKIKTNVEGLLNNYQIIIENS